MFVRASSTARVIDLHCIAGNPRVSVKRSTAPRTTESHLGLPHTANISKRPPRCPDLFSWSLLSIRRGKVFMCGMSGLFGEVVGGLEIPAKEPDLAVYIPRQERLCIRAGELAMDRDGRGAGNGCHLAGSLAAGLEAPDRAVENNQVGDTSGGAIAVAIDMLKCSLFLELMNEIFVKCNLKFGREFDFVRPDHFDLDCRRLNLGGQMFRGWRGVLLLAGRGGCGRFSRRCGMDTFGDKLCLDGVGSAHGH